MKKFYMLFLSLLITSLSFAQVQRTVLYEEFSGENCGPCASVNINHLNPLVKSNKGKLVLVKYQVPIPSAGPIYNITKPFFDGFVRQQTYQASRYFAPWGKLDGATPTGAADENPNNLTQTHIDNRSQVTSPYSIRITHEFKLGTTKDSVKVNYTVINKMPTTRQGTNEKIRIVMIEKELIFKTAPGSNGETEFHNIARSMVPTMDGIDIGNTFGAITTGDSVKGSYTVPIESHIYNIKEISFVAFIQNTQTKEVLQAGESTALNVYPNDTDGELTTTFTTNGYCFKTIKPKVTIKNKTTKTLSKPSFSITLNNGAPISYQATNEVINASQTKEIELSEITLLPKRSNVIKVTLLNFDGARDINAMDNEVTLTVRTIDTDVNDTSFLETFEDSAVFNTRFKHGWSPSNFILNPSIMHRDSMPTFVRLLRSQVMQNANGNNLALSTDKMGGFGNSNKSIYFPVWFFKAIEDNIQTTSYYGTTTNFVTQKFDYRTNNETYLEFDIAYGAIDETTKNLDQLTIESSIDCGVTWKSVKRYDLLNMITIPKNIRPVTPSSSEWKTESIRTTDLDKKASVMFRFSMDNYLGNGLFIDNITIKKTYSANSSILNGNSDITTNIYPNPFVSFVEISMNSNIKTDAQVRIFNSLGQMVFNESKFVKTGENNFNIDLSKLSSGIYNLSITSNEGLVLSSKQIIKN